MNHYPVQPISTQRGSISLVLSAILAIGLSVVGYYLYESHENISALQTQLDASKRKLRTTQRNLEASESSLNDQKSELYNLNRQRERLRNDINDINEQLRLAVEDTHQTKEEFKSTTEELQSALTKTELAYQEATQNLQSELARTEDEFKKTTHSLQSELARTENAHKKSTEELQLAFSQTEIEYTHKISQLNNLSGELHQKYQKTQEELAEERSRASNYNSTIETLEKRLIREQNALNQLQQQLDELNNKNIQLETEKDRLSQEKSQLHDEKNRLSLEKSRLDNEKNQLSQEKNQLIKQYEDGLTVIRLENTFLFSSGAVEMNDRGKETLALIAQTLKTFPNHLISIEGHTDHQPVTSSLAQKYPTNWELSSNRATFAVRYLIAKGLPAHQFQAVGFGSTRPIDLGNDPESQQNNRRIEILLHPPAERKMVQASIDNLPQ